MSQFFPTGTTTGVFTTDLAGTGTAPAQGTVIARCSATSVRIDQPFGSPVIHSPGTIRGLIVDGVLVDADTPGTPGLPLLASNAPGVSPAGFSWELSVTLTQDGKPVSEEKFIVPALAEGEQFDVSNAVGACVSGGTVVLRGETGATGKRGELGPSLYERNIELGLWPAERSEAEFLAERGGVQGPEGPEGLPGRDGIIGRDGLAGAPGVDGAMGPQGESGLPFTLKGSVATAAELPSVGVPAEGFYAQDSGEMLVWTEASGWVSVGVVRGPEGAQGPGGTGPAGRDGLNGLDGLPGAPGKQGVQGIKGEDSSVPGPEGQVGPAGPQGPEGAASTVPGPEGKPGKDGTQGAPGKDGVQGLPGGLGPAGPAPKLSIGAVQVGSEPAVSITGEDGSYVMDWTLPAGGAGGGAGTFIGTVIAESPMAGGRIRVLIDGESAHDPNGFRHLASAYKTPAPLDRVMLIEGPEAEKIIVARVGEIPSDGAATAEVLTNIHPSLKAADPLLYGDPAVHLVGGWVLTQGAFTNTGVAMSVGEVIAVIPEPYRPKNTELSALGIAIQVGTGASTNMLRLSVIAETGEIKLGTALATGVTISLSRLQWMSAELITETLGAGLGAGVDAFGWMGFSGSTVAGATVGAGRANGEIQQIVSWGATVSVNANGAFSNIGRPVSNGFYRTVQDGVVWNQLVLEPGFTGELWHAKRSDGLAAIYGSVTGGSAGQPAAYLPEGYRPAVLVAHRWNSFDRFTDFTLTWGGAIIPAQPKAGGVLTPLLYRSNH